MSLQSSDISFSLILLLASMLSNDRQTNEKFVEIDSEDVPSFSRIEPLHHLLVVLVENVEEDGPLSSRPRTQEENNSLVKYQSNFPFTGMMLGEFPLSLLWLCFCL